LEFRIYLELPSLSVCLSVGIKTCPY